MKWFTIITAFLITLLFAIIAHSANRCEAYVQTVRVEHIKTFGLQFPYWYSVSQLSAESSCRATVQAWDLGQGVAQFMPKTSKYIQSLMGESLDPYNPKHAIRMQAFYMSRIHKVENWSDRLFIDFQIYNGGRTTLYKEYQRAGILDWDRMRSVCQRKKVQTKWGILDLCEVNYSYSQKIHSGANLYRRGDDGGYRFW